MVNNPSEANYVGKRTEFRACLVQRTVLDSILVTLWPPFSVLSNPAIEAFL